MTQNHFIMITLSSFFLALTFYPIAALVTWPFYKRVKKLNLTIPQMYTMREYIPKHFWGLYLLRVSLESRRLAKKRKFRAYRKELKSLRKTTSLFNWVTALLSATVAIYMMSGSLIMVGLIIFKSLT